MHKDILITGASTGLGAAMAAKLVDRGHRVVGTSRRAAVPLRLLEGELTMAPLDVCKDESVEELKAWLNDVNFNPDVIILNAGNGISGSIEHTSDQAARNQFETNFFGVHRMVRAFLPQLRRRKSGHILIVSSMAGMVSIPFQGLYSASKFAVEGYAEALRAEVMAHGLKVSLIEPGDYKTNFGESQLSNESNTCSGYEPQASRAIQKMRDSEDNGGDPVELADLVERIIRTPNPKLRYLSGSIIERLGIRLKRILPGSLFERLIMQIYEVPRKNPD
ncbi:MAG: short-chain dehydrogenase/reductase [Cellvibrionaceae bacterium]|nr:short-chain dehydrogenase/reductase [Cellvibrionaceae bacterium]|tara:strand:- start:7031 stop:7861 length:831 start_codon:yes stop_codon:yes gene_type:complete